MSGVKKKAPLGEVVADVAERTAPLGTALQTMHDRDPSGPVGDYIGPVNKVTTVALGGNTANVSASAQTQAAQIPTNVADVSMFPKTAKDKLATGRAASTPDNDTTSSANDSNTKPGGP